MTVFENYEEKRGAYQSAKSNYSTILKYASWVNVDSKEDSKNYINALRENLNALELAKSELDNIMEKIAEASTISIEEAKIVFSKLLKDIGENGITEYEVQVFIEKGKKYLELYNPNHLEEQSIYIPTNDIFENELFHFYWINQEDNKESLQGFEICNMGSKLLDNVIRFVRTYIEYKIAGKVNSWKDFVERYYTYGELNPYDEIETERIELLHDKEALKHAKRRKKEMANREAKEGKKYSRKASLLTNEGEVNSYYGRPAIYLQESYNEEELRALESLLRNYSSEELADLIDIIINNRACLPKQYSRELTNNR